MGSPESGARCNPAAGTTVRSCAVDLPEVHAVARLDVGYAAAGLGNATYSDTAGTVGKRAPETCGAADRVKVLKSDGRRLDRNLHLTLSRLGCLALNDFHHLGWIAVR